MSVFYSAAGVRATTLGLKVARATALPPATGVSEDLFTIDGGQVLLVGLFGYVTVAIPNVTLSFDLAFDPDSGGSDVVLGSATSVQAAAAGTFISLNTTAAGAVVVSVDVARNGRLASPIVLDAGDIKLNVTGGGAIGTTARVRWDAIYVPWSDGALLTRVAAP